MNPQQQAQQQNNMNNPVPVPQPIQSQPVQQAQQPAVQQQAMSNPTPIGAVNLVEQIIKVLELEGMDPGQQKEIVDKMTQIVLSRASIRLTDQMTDEELEEFEKVVDSNGMEQGLKYLAQIFPNIPGIIQEELNNLQSEVKADLTYTPEDTPQQSQPVQPVPNMNQQSSMPTMAPLSSVPPLNNVKPPQMPPQYLADDLNDQQPDIEDIVPSENL